MAIPQDDFFTIFIEEGEPFYNDISKLDSSHFNKWVTENFIMLYKIDSFNEVAPSNDLIHDFKTKGYHHISSQCHYSAKAINILNPDFEYWTGFINRNCSVFPIITHSFNVYNSNIIDFARITDDLKIIEPKINDFPHIYYGVKVPNELVKKYENETFYKHSMKPLLYELYLFQENENNIV